MYTSTNLDSELLRVYSKDNLFEPCERSQTRVWDDIEEATDETPNGSGLRFRIVGNSGGSQGNPAEGGDYSDHNPRLQVECVVTSAQTDSVCEVSEKFLRMAKDDGSYSGDAEHEGIVETTKGLFAYQDILLGCGHGTGRLAIVESTVVASTTFTASLPESVFQLRRGHLYDAVNTDTGGTVQVTGFKILAINPRTRVVTTDTAISLTAGWGIYKTGVYGNPIPNGLRNIVDNGDFASTIFGVSRAGANEFLNATVMDGSGGLQDYSEELVRDLLNQVTTIQDLIPSELRCNVGIVDEHLRVTTPDRVYNVNGSKVPSYATGANHEALMFAYGEQNIKFRVDRNLPARELYAIHRPSLRKHTLRKADWFRGKGMPAFMPKPANAGGTWSYAFIASMMLDMNISSKKLNCNGKLKNIRDRSAARDS